MKRIQTHYRHLYNADGSRRAEPCSGFLEIICDDYGVYVHCAECDDGYQFEFVMPGDLLEKGQARRND